jgi:WD40 repeat protein
MLAVSGFTSGVQVWDTKTGQSLMKTEEFHLASALTLSPDGKRLAAGGFSNATGGYRIQAYEVATGRRLWEADANERAVGTAALAFSPDGATVAAAMDNKRIVLLDANEGREKSSFPAGAVTAVRYGAGGLLSAGGGQVTLWEANTGRELWKDSVRSGARIGISADGAVIVLGGWNVLAGDGPLQVAEVWTKGGAARAATAAAAASPPGWQRLDLAGHGGYVLAVAFGPKRNVGAQSLHCGAAGA